MSDICKHCKVSTKITVVWNSFSGSCNICIYLAGRMICKFADVYVPLLLHFDWGMLITIVSTPPNFFLIDDLEVYKFEGTLLVFFTIIIVWGNLITGIHSDFSIKFFLIKGLGVKYFEQTIWGKYIGGFVVVLGLIYWTSIESVSFWSYAEKSSALWSAHVLVRVFGYDYCGSIPLATAFDINIRVFGAVAVVLVWCWTLDTWGMYCSIYLAWIARCRVVRFGWTFSWRAHRQGGGCWFMPTHKSDVWCVWLHRIYGNGDIQIW